MRESLTLETVVKTLQSDIEQIKVAQGTSGDSWILYKIISNNESDISVPLISNGEGYRYLITFTPDNDGLSIAHCEADIFRTGGLNFADIFPVYGSFNQWVFFVGCLDSGPVTNLTSKILVRSTQTGTFSVEFLGVV